MDDPTPAPLSLSRRPSRLARVWRATWLAAVGGWLLWLLARAELDFGGLWRQPALWVFAAGWLLVPTGLGLLWWRLLRRVHGSTVACTEALRAQAIAWAGRYLPGKAGMWLAKFSLLHRGGLDARALGHSLLVEQVTFVAGGVILVLACLPWAELGAALAGRFATTPWHWLLANELSLRAALAAASLVGYLVLIRLLTRLLRVHIVIRSGFWLGLLAAHLGVQAVVGLSLFPLAAAVVPASAEALGVTGVIGALAFANVAGILAVFAPAGLGIREAGLALILAIAAPWPEAVAFAALTRGVTLLADTVFAAGGWLLLGRSAGIQS